MFFIAYAGGALAARPALPVFANTFWGATRRHSISISLAANIEKWEESAIVSRLDCGRSLKRMCGVEETPNDRKPPDTFQQDP